MIDLPDGRYGVRVQGPAWIPARWVIGRCFDCGDPCYTVDEAGAPCHPACGADAVRPAETQRVFAPGPPGPRAGYRVFTPTEPQTAA